MQHLSRRTVLQGLCGCSAMALGGCVTSEESRQPLKTAGYRPASNTLEGGLWQKMEEFEEELKHSPIRVRDPGLNRYVTELACDLAGDHCRNLRVYIVDTPHFNASMAPNGMMQIWTGLLLRCRNEAELAAVVGHEIAHYTQRHTLQRYEQLSNSAAAAAFFSVLLAGVGGGGFAGLIQLAALANVLAFSRDQEREADQIGMEMMSRAGYAPVAAAQIWQGIVTELDAGLSDEEKDERRNKQSVWTATHPSPDERMRELNRMAALQISGPVRFAEESFRTATADRRDAMMEAELSLHQYDRSLVIIDRLLEAAPGDASVHYYRGEVFRRRNDGNDSLRALNAYGEAVEIDPSHARSWRGIGILHRRAGRTEDARAAFRRYLQLDPAADDRLMIQSFLGADT